MKAWKLPLEPAAAGLVKTSIYTLNFTRPSNEAYGLLSFKKNRGDANLAAMKVRDLGKARIIFMPKYERTQIGWFDTTAGLNTYEKWATYTNDGLNAKRPASGRAPWPTMLVMSAASTGLVPHTAYYNGWPASQAAKFRGDWKDRAVGFVKLDYVSWTPDLNLAIAETNYRQ